MKIAVIDGSPRENGNTENLVKAIAEGSVLKGAETNYFKLAKMKISPCMGCIDCRKTGICIIDDDMQKLYAAIQESDAIVLGSPVYMGQINSHTKAFLDRLVKFLKPDFSTRFNGRKKLLLAFAQGNPDAGAFQVYFDYLQKMLSRMFDVKGTVLANGCRDIGDLLTKSEILDRARDAGRSLTL